MIQKSLVYIYATHPRRTFTGCGAFVEGGYVATCRHVWRMATETDGTVVSDRVEVVFPHDVDGDDPPIVGTLASACDAKPGRRPDLVLLSPSAVPRDVVALQAATGAIWETGPATAYAGLPGQPSGAIAGIGEVTIDGTLAVATSSNGLRQFTGSNPTGFWLERGSSGSPVFLVQGQQLAGILSLSMLGANAGKTHLHEAHVVPGTVVRDHLIALQAVPVATERHIPVADLQDILARLGAQDVAVADIPRLLREFIEASQAHGREPLAASNDIDITATVERSRSLVQDFKPSEALSVLNARIAEENEARARRLLPLLKEQAEVQRIVFDHAGRLATLEEIARIDRSDISAWIEIGDIEILLGHSEEAQSAYHRAQSAAEAARDEREISVSHNRIGDVLVSQGDGAGALAAYQASLALRTA
ncbi:hypothetical protein ACQVP2_28935, partial [Methylobacterium aquaticum]|uniref:hypothetical protein n=1 Tax=Methylobacterium aquaticum TaxID=270351 RepID=UPI003D17BFDF